MISISNNKEEIFRKGLNDDVVKSFRKEVIYKINNNDSATFSTSCQNYLTQVMLVFCKAITFSNRFENIGLQETIRGFKENGVNFGAITSFVCNDILNNRSLYFELRSTMLNERSNTLKHAWSKSNPNGNIGQIVIVSNKLMNALNEYAETEAFNYCKLRNNPATPHISTKDQMFKERKNEYWTKIGDIKLRLTFGGNCIVDRYTNAAKFSIRVSWEDVDIEKYKRIQLTVGVDGKVLLDRFNIRLERENGYFVVIFRIPKELVGSDYQTISVDGRIYAIGHQWAVLKKNREFEYADASFSTPLTARIFPQSSNLCDNSKNPGIYKQGGFERKDNTLQARTSNIPQASKVNSKQEDAKEMALLLEQFNKIMASND